MKTNQEFYLKLVCLSRTQLKLSKDHTELISEAAAMAFPIRDGIPIMLLDEEKDRLIFYQ